ncbi:MAG: SH3 domain-containing protein [Eubacteriales bacterium]|nr:SH3 domain-containing protein [Eubacteriales bacterium]
MKRFCMEFQGEIALMLISALGLLFLWRCEHASFAEEAPPVESRYVLVSDTLRVRDKDGFDGEIIGWLDAGDCVTVIRDGKGWTKVKCGVEAGEGWVKSEYLTNRAADAGRYKNTSGGRIHIRNGVGGGHLDWLDGGKTVTVTVWCSDAEGTLWGFMGDGWVKYDCLSKVDEE